MKTRVVLLMLLFFAMFVQGCIISLGNQGCSSTAQKPKSASAFQETLNTINHLPNEDAKIEALWALIQTPMTDEDYIAVIKSIDSINNADDRQELLIEAINARRQLKTPVKQLPCGD